MVDFLAGLCLCVFVFLIGFILGLGLMYAAFEAEIKENRLKLGDRKFYVTPRS